MRKFTAMAIPLALSSLLLSQMVLPVKGNELENKLNNYQQQLSGINSNLASEQEQLTGVKNQYLSLQQSITALNESIKSYDRVLKGKQAEFENLKQQQEKLEQNRQEHIKSLGALLKLNYESGGAISYLALLLNANSLSDLLSRAEEVKHIVNYYHGLQDQIATLNKSINAQQVTVQDKMNQIQAEIAAKQQLQTSLQQAASKQQEIANNLSVHEKATLLAQANTLNNIREVQQEIAHQELEAQLAAQKPISETSSGGVSTPVQVSGGAGPIVAFASQFLGVPYVWGGTTPDPGFDCSGYIQYVFAHFGVHLYRVSQDQYKEGIPVLRDDLQPGDLVFFQTYAPGATHVGIYVGNNLMLDAANAGIKYTNITSSYYNPRYLGARRIISH